MTSTMLKVCSLRTEIPTRAGLVRAVNDVSFTVNVGQLVGIVGETGAGKSLTVRSILGLLPSPARVVEGVVTLHDRDLLTLPPKALRKVRGSEISFVPQNPFGALHPTMRLEDQFASLVNAHRAGNRKTGRRMAMEVLARLGIPQPDRVLRGFAHELSGGMAQRVVIAMALILSPDLVIADEPTTGLDLTVQMQILDLVVDLLQSERRAMLLVTHDLGVVAQYCDRVVVMYAGTIVEEGPVRKVFREPAHPYTRALLSAVPNSGRPLKPLGGTLPSLIDYPPGCAFADRCPVALPRCRVDLPQKVQVESGWEAACHLIESPRSVARPRAAKERI